MESKCQNEKIFHASASSQLVEETGAGQASDIRRGPDYRKVRGPGSKPQTTPIRALTLNLGTVIGESEASHALDWTTGR